jgi:23S rRNA-intervening sequence protein
MAFSFEKLLVYQKAVDFADKICDRTERFERGYRFLADQLNRAAVSTSNEAHRPRLGPFVILATISPIDGHSVASRRSRRRSHANRRAGVNTNRASGRPPPLEKGTPPHMLANI